MKIRQMKQVAQYVMYQYYDWHLIGNMVTKDTPHLTVDINFHYFLWFGIYSMW